MPDPTAIMQRYPYQLSGGQQQRVVIAMALVTNPDVLIMDEPTTGLDETTAAAVLDLVSELKHTFDAAILYISHDLSVVARVCDRVGVMYAGQLVESGHIHDAFHQPHHPYTADLLACVPDLDKHYRHARLRTIEGKVPSPANLPTGCVYHPRCRFARERCRQSSPPFANTGRHNHHQARCFFGDEVAQHFSANVPTPANVPALHQPNQQHRQHQQPMLTLTNLCKDYLQQRPGLFSRRSAPIQAVNNVSLTIHEGETFSLVGESGCGKTTLGRCVVGLVTPSAGTIVFRGHDATLPAAQRLVRLRQAVQMVFQQPETTLNPRHTVGLMLERTLQCLGMDSRSERRERIVELLAAVHLDTSYARRYPIQLSGGEKQRVAIARAFAGNPDMVVCDEAVSALDVSVRAAILNLLVDLKHEHQCAYLFVSHDLGVVRYLSDRIGVMYLGQLMEIGLTAQVFAAPSHPYTEALLSAITTPHTNGQGATLRLDGPLPNPAHPPAGCPFHTRCPRKVGAICEQEPPPWQMSSEEHLIRCHIALDDLHTMQSESRDALVTRGTRRAGGVKTEG